MKYKCLNEIDYNECSNMVEKEDTYCTECQEEQYTRHLESLYGGTGPLSLKEQQDNAMKLK